MSQPQKSKKKTVGLIFSLIVVSSQ